MCVHVCVLSRWVVSDSETPWTVVCLAPLSLGFFKQEILEQVTISSQGIFPTQGRKPSLPHLLHWQVCFTAVPPGKPLSRCIRHCLGTSLLAKPIAFAVGCVQSWSGLSSLWVHWFTASLHPGGHFPGSWTCDQIRTVVGSLAWEVRAVIVGRDNQKLLKLSPSLSQMANWNNTAVGRNQVSKECRGSGPTVSPFNFLVKPLKKSQ